MTPEQRLREAKVRVRAKEFARRLRSEGWAEPIPSEDEDWLEDSEFPLYKATLKAYGCTQRPDFKWERSY